MKAASAASGGSKFCKVSLFHICSFIHRKVALFLKLLVCISWLYIITIIKYIKISSSFSASSISRYNQRYGVGMGGTGLTGSGLGGPGLSSSGLPSTGLSGLTGSSLVGPSGLSSGLVGSSLTGTGLGTSGIGSSLGGGYDPSGLGLSSYSKFGTSRRNRSLDYSSDTEATAPTRTPYYSGLSGYRSSTLGRDISSKFNSLPRDVRGTNTR